MGTVKVFRPNRPIALQTRLALSMAYQVKHKLKIEKWMSGRDVVEANPMIFDRIRRAVTADYHCSYTVDYSWKAADILLKGMQYDIEPPA